MGKRRALRSLIFILLLCTWTCLPLCGAAGCALFRPTLKPPRTTFEEVERQIQLEGPSPLTAGVAKVEITPPVGTPLAGYAKRRGRPSVGIRDPLFVRVLALKDGEDTLVLISADLLVFPYPFAESIVQRISHQMKIPRQAICLMATHTHSGTGSIATGLLYEQVFGGYRSDVAEGLVGRVLWAVRQALEHQKPVRWGIKEGWLEGLSENRRSPSGPTDTKVAVLLLESQEGPFGVLVNWAAHPTLLDSQDMRFSADYPGQLCQTIEKSYPGSVCLFANGAAGDLRPQDSIGSTPEERVTRLGNALAEVTTGIINQMELYLNGDCAAWGWWQALPPPQVHIGRLPLHPAIGRLMRPTAVYLQLMGLDEAVFIPLPAELTTELGQELFRKLSTQGVQPFLLGYAGGYVGYAVSPEQYKTRSYEAWMSWYGPTFGVWVVEELRLLASLYRKKKS